MRTSGVFTRGIFCVSKRVHFISSYRPIQRQLCNPSIRKESVWASTLVNKCTEIERQHLFEALQKQSNSPANNYIPCSTRQLRLVFLASSTPFIGFGFLDNLIMLLAGEYIDLTLATVCGFSTLAAAGFGNLISDICGLGSVNYVEKYASLLGVQMPSLTVTQLSSRPVRRVSNLGRMFGTALGCLLGMFPLLFFPDGTTDDKTANELNKLESEKP